MIIMPSTIFFYRFKNLIRITDTRANLFTANGAATISACLYFSEGPHMS